MQLKKLELLAPARNLEIGTAAIDCGADAVYIAGPAFGARVAAANSIEDVGRLCDYAHKFGAKVFATLNTLLEENEKKEAERLIRDYYEAGIDALIIQDLSLLDMNLPPVELHASTQSVIRTPEDAIRLERLGFTRLILERQLSLETIRAIRDAVSCDMEFFVHGALCVSYSGQCYLSQAITGRSANRGCCAQPCRSRYDLLDADGNVLVKDRTLLSLKDLRLDAHIAELALSGISSFKIEGRLKNASYVKNIVRHYRDVIDVFISLHPDYCKASFGHLQGGFKPNPDLTFNRGYTSCFIDGNKDEWNSRDAAKSLGEYIGEISAVEGRRIKIGGEKRLVNGDGLSFVGHGEESIGMRADVVEGRNVLLKDTSSLSRGMKVYRSLNVSFEKELEKNMPLRVVDAVVDYHSEGGVTLFSAISEDGRTAEVRIDDNAPVAEKPERALETLRQQVGKMSEIYEFRVGTIECDVVRFYPASFLNAIRRQLAAQLSAFRQERPQIKPLPAHGALSQTSTLEVGKELMRMKYCIRHELGLCPAQNPARKVREPLILRNQNRTFRLSFDCKNCEMVVLL